MDNSFKLRKLISILFHSIITIGCTLQSVSIVNFYLTYPTSIHIDTQFDIGSATLASFTLCKRFGRNFGQNSSSLFEFYRTIDSVKIIYIISPKHLVIIDLDDSSNQYVTRIDSVSITYYCFSLQGELINKINVNF